MFLQLYKKKAFIVEMNADSVFINIQVYIFNGT